MIRSYIVECWRCDAQISASARYCSVCGEVQFVGGESHVDG